MLVMQMVSAPDTTTLRPDPGARLLPANSGLSYLKGLLLSSPPTRCCERTPRTAYFCLGKVQMMEELAKATAHRDKTRLVVNGNVIILKTAAILCLR